MADSSRSRAAYVSGGRGRIWTPTINLRIMTLVLRPLFLQCSVSAAYSMSSNHRPIKCSLCLMFALLSHKNTSHGEKYFVVGFRGFAA